MREPSMVMSALLNGSPCDAPLLSDRGFAYGDGLFETIRVTERQPVLWELHMKRLRLGCERLWIPLFHDFEYRLEAWFGQLVGSVSSGESDLIVKIILTRGSGGRGYKPAQTSPNVIMLCSQFSSELLQAQSAGMRVKRLQYRLPSNPVLAGIKHLNRLDQVIASMELTDEDEGLVSDQSGHVIEGTKTNLFLFSCGRIITPDLSQSGIQGVLRQYILEQAAELGWQVQVQPVRVEDLWSASGIALGNSLIGLCPVRQLDDVILDVPAELKQFQNVLHKKLRL